MEALNDLRQDIDALDAQLAALYRRRMDVAARIAAVKREQGLPVLQPEREREIRARLAELAAPALQPGMQAWFEALRAASRDWQEAVSPPPARACAAACWASTCATAIPRKFTPCSARIPMTCSRSRRRGWRTSCTARRGTD
ncbi:MAG: chorismate mutase [Oscillospiraceae bacterium]